MAVLTRLAQIGKECVACGSCLRICPKGAIRMVSGITARVDRNACIGCGRCAKTCPADVITLVQREAGE